MRSRDQRNKGKKRKQKPRFEDLGKSYVIDYYPQGKSLSHKRFEDYNPLVVVVTVEKFQFYDVILTMGSNYSVGEDLVLSPRNKNIFRLSPIRYNQLSSSALSNLPTIIKKIVEISSFSRLLDYKIENVDDFDLAPLLSYDFVTEKLLNPAGNLRIIPGLDEIRLDYDLIGKEDRDFPIDFDGIYSKEAEITIVLPESLKVKYLPQDINLETPWFRFKYGFKAEKNKIISSQNFEVRRRFVKNEEYKEFKKSLEKVFYLLREQIILERIN